MSTIKFPSTWRGWWEVCLGSCYLVLSLCLTTKGESRKNRVSPSAPDTVSSQGSKRLPQTTQHMEPTQRSLLQGTTSSTANQRDWRRLGAAGILWGQKGW